MSDCVDKKSTHFEGKNGETYKITSISLPLSLYGDIKKFADLNKISVSKFIVLLLTQFAEDNTNDAE